MQRINSRHITSWDPLTQTHHRTCCRVRLWPVARERFSFGCIGARHRQTVTNVANTRSVTHQFLESEDSFVSPTWPMRSKRSCCFANIGHRHCTTHRGQLFNASTAVRLSELLESMVTPHPRCPFNFAYVSLMLANSIASYSFSSVQPSVSPSLSSYLFASAENRPHHRTRQPHREHRLET